MIISLDSESFFFLQNPTYIFHKNIGHWKSRRKIPQYNKINIYEKPIVNYR